MATDLPRKNPPERYLIGDLELDAGKASVARDAEDIPLPRLSFDLLLCLARHAPDIVSTDTMMDEVWGKTVVGEETVKQRIKLLRQGLDDRSSDPVYFEAVRGRGYRMIAEVSVPTDADGDGQKNGRRQLRGRYGFALAVLLGVLMAGAWFLLEPDTSTEGSRRVAVLPFSFIGAQPDDDYIADGVTEEMITALAQLTDLRIIARTSVMRYRNTRKPVSEIAAELNVGTVLEGSIQHFGDELRITVQMIDATTEEHYWAQTFDVSLADLPLVQVELSERVASSLAATISVMGREAIMRNLTHEPAAWDLYLKGREAYRRWTQRDNEIALAFYRQALDLDPEFALAIAGSANALALRTTEFGGDAQSAREAVIEANRALAINPDLAEAHKALGIVSFFEGRYQATVDHYLEALQLKPGYDEALFNLAETYQVLGRWDEAVYYQIQDSLRPQGLEQLSIYLRDLGLDEEADSIAAPLSSEIPVSFYSDDNLALHFLLAGEFEKAREHARRLQNYFPNQPAGWMREADIDLRAGDRVGAEKNTTVAESMPAVFNIYPKLRLAQLLLERGELERSTVLFDEVEAISRKRISNGHEGWYFPWNLAFIHSLRGEPEAALGWFEKAVDAGRRRYEWDEQESAFGLIAGEPRFQAALQKQRIAREEMKRKVSQELKRGR